MKEQWEKLQQLFEQASALEGDERRLFLDEHCAGDADFRGKLEDLLAADEEQTGRTQPLVSDTELDWELKGSQLGVYQLMSRIGAGGMGSVFLAERADGVFERQVAVKVVKKGMDTEHVVQRFEAERQILSRLDHPNIAALLDGGVTADGRPYFVMELVDGLPITDYCDQHRLSIEERLELFQVVCTAVHHAHQNLVVHRDLKPSNILVTNNGEVKLLDFGIAKVLDDNEDAHLTRTGMPLLTPAYASPEQLIGQPVTTGSDIYALGVILIELLAGRRPYEAMRTPEEMRQQVLSAQAPKPSTLLSQQISDDDGKPGTQSLESVSASRCVGPNRLRQALSGDLDTICLMAIRLEPGERYASALQLAEDLFRHLDGQPVRAQPPSTVYRLKKFVGRHRVGVVASVMVALAIAALTTFYTQKLAMERDSALREQAKVSEVAKFVIGLFEEADPDQSRGQAVTVQQLLEAGRRQIENELTGQPDLQATMKRVLGGVYYKLGSDAEAEVLLRSALEQQTSSNQPLSMEAATTLLGLGLIEQYRGDYEAAAESMQQALEVRTAELGRDHADVREVIAAQAFLEETRANYELASSQHEEAFAMAQRLYTGDDVALAQAHSELAGFYRMQDRRDEAEVLLRDGIAMMERLYDEPHPLSAKMTRQLAGLLRNSNRPEESEPLFKKAIAEQEAMLGPDHHELGVSWGGYSQLLTNMGRFDEALEAHRNMLDILERRHDGPHPSLGPAYNNLAFMMMDLDRWEEAREYFELSLEMQDAVGLPPRHLNRTFPTTGLAKLLYFEGEYEQSEAIYRDMLAIRQEVLGDEHRLTAESKSNLSAVLLETDQLAEAEVLLLEAHTFFKATQNATSVRRVETALRLADLYQKLGDPEAAAPYDLEVEQSGLERP